MIGRCNSRVKPMNTTHPLKMTPDRYDHPVHGPLNVCILFTLPTPQSPTWVRGPPARLTRCGAGITPTTNEGHSPPLEREVKRLRPIVRSPPHNHPPGCAGLRPALCGVGLALPPPQTKDIAHRWNGNRCIRMMRHPHSRQWGMDGS
jgi:hypothetical protein